MSEDKVTYSVNVPIRYELRTLSADTLFIADDGRSYMVPAGTVMQFPIYGDFSVEIK